TVDNNGKIIVPAGVKEFTISMKTVEDSTTEGDETVQFTIGGVTGNEATIKDTSTTPPAEKPTVTPSTTDGSVSVVPGPNNTSTTATFIGEDGAVKTVTVTKQPDGTWKLDDPDNTGATITDPTTGEVKIPQDSILDNTPVTVVGKETGKTDSAPVDGTAGEDSKDAEVDNS
ncbi:hypothetical protein, partial [Moraxella cuniculi]|uniref:hypothetical protein n=1 Tax=Moraxella cuniculi TaxID=34061 RepID=UPI001B80594D